MLKADRNNKKKTARLKPIKEKEHTKKKWCVLFGFNVDSTSDVGYLAFTTPEDLKYLKTSRIQTYKIVDDPLEAACFPCENYSHKSDFASPEKWLEFFKNEPELKKWKFHLVTRLHTNESKNKEKSKCG